MLRLVESARQPEAMSAGSADACQWCSGISISTPPDVGRMSFPSCVPPFNRWAQHWPEVCRAALIASGCLADVHEPQHRRGRTASPRQCHLRRTSMDRGRFRHMNVGAAQWSRWDRWTSRSAHAVRLLERDPRLPRNRPAKILNPSRVIPARHWSSVFARRNSGDPAAALSVLRRLPWLNPLGRGALRTRCDPGRTGTGRGRRCRAPHGGGASIRSFPMPGVPSRITCGDGR